MVGTVLLGPIPPAGREGFDEFNRHGGVLWINESFETILTIREDLMVMDRYSATDDSKDSFANIANLDANVLQSGTSFLQELPHPCIGTPALG